MDTSDELQRLCCETNDKQQQFSWFGDNARSEDILSKSSSFHSLIAAHFHQIHELLYNWMRRVRNVDEY
jgi:hypothetical protein